MITKLNEYIDINKIKGLTVDEIATSLILKGCENCFSNALKVKYGNNIPLYYKSSLYEAEIIDNKGLSLGGDGKYFTIGQPPKEGNLFFNKMEKNEDSVIYRLDVPLLFINTYAYIDMSNVHISDEKLMEYDVDIDEISVDSRNIIEYFIFNNFKLDGLEIHVIDDQDNKIVKPTKITYDVLTESKDSDLITVYHAAKKLPSKIEKGIFYVTKNRKYASEHAKARGGEVFTLKINPKYLHNGADSNEFEFHNGGDVIDGKVTDGKVTNYIIIPNENKENGLVEYNIISDKFKVSKPISRWFITSIAYHEIKNSKENAFNKIKDDIDYFIELKDKSKHLKEFSKELKYDNIDDLKKDMVKLSKIKFSDIYK